MVRNGGTHGNISVNWVLTRNSSDPSPVTADIRPSSGVLHFAQGQMLASIPLTVVDDDLPEEAEAYLLINYVVARDCADTHSTNKTYTSINSKSAF